MRSRCAAAYRPRARRLYRAETTLFPTNYTVNGLSGRMRLPSCCTVEELNCTVEERKSSNVKAAEINPQRQPVWHEYCYHMSELPC
jgi:hypothetical protein